MKSKKLLALTIALIMALSCMSLTAFAEGTPIVTFTAAATTPEFVEGTAKTAAIGTVAADDFSGIVAYEAKVYTASTGTTEATGITAAVDGTALKVTTTTGAAQGTYYISVKGTYDTESDELDARVSFKVYGAILDLEEGDDYLNTKTGIEQTYTATVNGQNTHKTKVQVSWTLEDITVTVNNKKVWNTETLKWDDAADSGAEASDPTATFNFVNLSSKDVYAKVSFAVEDGFEDPTEAYTDNDETDGDGIIKLGTKATSSATDNNGKIELALTVNDSDFDGASAGTDTYGTYTVKISTTDPTEYNVTFNMKDHGTEISGYKVVTGSTLTAPTPAPTDDYYDFDGWYKEDSLTTAWDFANDTVTANTVLYAKWTAKVQ